MILKQKDSDNGHGQRLHTGKRRKHNRSGDKFDAHHIKLLEHRQNRTDSDGIKQNMGIKPKSAFFFLSDMRFGEIYGKPEKCRKNINKQKVCIGRIGHFRAVGQIENFLYTSGKTRT